MKKALASKPQQWVSSNHTPPVTRKPDRALELSKPVLPFTPVAANSIAKSDGEPSWIRQSKYSAPNHTR
jgi:hypothetical protein